MTRHAFVVIAVLLACSCAAPGPAPGPEAPPSGPCGGVGPPPAAAQVTFSTNGRLYSAAPDGSGMRCLVEGVSGPIVWGPAADRVVFGSLAAYLSSGTTAPAVDERVASSALSAPTGKSIVYVPADHTHLLKRPTIGGEHTEISFLDRHDEVVYHPAGTHVAVVGSSEEGAGIWRATNTGGAPRLLAQGESARRIYSLSYAADGFLAFAADHGGRYDVHWLAPSGQLETIRSGEQPVDRVVGSPFSDAVAYRTGSCSSATTTRAWIARRDRSVERFRGLSTEPAGWLPDGSLLVLARSHGCSGKADAWVWTEKGAHRIARGVDAAGVRAVLPPPPAPPGDPGEAAG